MSKPLKWDYGKKLLNPEKEERKINSQVALRRIYLAHHGVDSQTGFQDFVMLSYNKQYNFCCSCFLISYLERLRLTLNVTDFGAVSKKLQKKSFLNTQFPSELISCILLFSRVLAKLLWANYAYRSFCYNPFFKITVIQKDLLFKFYFVAKLVVGIIQESLSVCAIRKYTIKGNT